MIYEICDEDKISKAFNNVESMNMKVKAKWFHSMKHENEHGWE
jgi:hypothetical protein